MDGILKVWDLASGQELRTLNGHERPCVHVTICPDGRFVFSGFGDGTLIAWDTTTWKPILPLVGLEAVISGVATTRDGSFLVSSYLGNTLRVWDFTTGRLLALFQGEGGISCCACAADGRTFLAGDRSGGVHFLRLESLSAGKLGLALQVSNSSLRRAISSVAKATQRILLAIIELLKLQRWTLSNKKPRL